MDMSYEDMKDLMRILDNNNIPYEFGHHYGHEFLSNGDEVHYRNGHYIILFGKVIDCWEIDEEDDKWNRG